MGRLYCCCGGQTFSKIGLRLLEITLQTRNNNSLLQPTCMRCIVFERTSRRAAKAPAGRSPEDKRIIFHRHRRRRRACWGEVKLLTAFFYNSLLKLNLMQGSRLRRVEFHMCANASLAREGISAAAAQSVSRDRSCQIPILPDLFCCFKMPFHILIFYFC